MKIFPHIRLHFLWFCQKQNNFFVACKRLQFFGVVKTTKLIFFACISVQFEFCFCEIYNNRVFFHVLHFIFYGFVQNNTKKVSFPCI